MAINKKLIHFKNYSDFNSKKLSANEANTAYTVGVEGAITTGSPDILYQSICWIKDKQYMWTHGTLYDCSGGSGESDANVQAVDTSETLEDVNTITYVKYVAQTLTDAQKEQARTNIGAAAEGATGGGTVDLSNYYTKEEVDAITGDINSVLGSIINGSANIITFSIYQTPFGTTVEYQAESGMTWEAWCNSSYNTSGYYVEGGNIADGNDYGVFVGLDGVNVLSTDIIQANTTYEWN